MTAPESPNGSATSSTVSERKRLANAANARHSTGPSSEAGKQRSAANATKHGGYASTPTPISRGAFAEDPNGLRQYIDEIVTALAPRDAIERAQAQRIAQCYVRAARLNRYEAELLSAPRPEELSDDNPNDVDTAPEQWRYVQQWLTTGDDSGVNFNRLNADLVLLAVSTNRLNTLLLVPAELVVNGSDRDTCEAYLDVLFAHRALASDWAAKQLQRAKSEILHREGATARSADYCVTETNKIEIMRQRIARELDRAQSQYDQLQRRRLLPSGAADVRSRNEPTAKAPTH